MKYQKGNISVILSFIIVVCIIGFGVYFLVTNFDDSKEPAITSATPDNQNNNVVTQDNTTTKSMDQIAKNGDTLSMNYTGRLTNGTVFDSNVDPKFGHVTPFEFVLGAGQVIKGWDEGLVGMKVGEKKTLTIPPEKGYGATGAGSAIPPNATLIFDVELLGIK